MKTKTLNVGVFCTAYYNSFIEVPANMNLEEAIEYAQKHIKELPIVNGLEYVGGSDELDKNNCDFE